MEIRGQEREIKERKKGVGGRGLKKDAQWYV
jgi:hypothetical protein